MQQFGRYTLVQRIAQGGMAEVWRAAMVGAMGFTKPLAIKRIRQESAKDPEFVRMLVDEARIASTLRHPNVVQVTDLGEIDGQYFIAMEYVSGRHLGQVLAQSLHNKTLLPRAFALYVTREALLGLHHAHQKVDAKGRPLNIVHRDVSPQNIMVGFDGSVRVADFGIAKAYGRRTMTEAGVLKGKYAYMAPEQARSEPLDARSDIYAMGVVLWEALANKRMYPTALDSLDVLKKVSAGEHPPLSAVMPDLPADVVAVVDKALALNPADRYPTAEAFAQAAGMALGKLAPAYGALPVSAYMRDLFGEAVKEEEQKLAELDSLARRYSSVVIPAFSGSTPPAAPAPSAPAPVDLGQAAPAPAAPAPSVHTAATALMPPTASGVAPPSEAPTTPHQPAPRKPQPSGRGPLVVLGLGAVALVGALVFRMTAGGAAGGGTDSPVVGAPGPLQPDQPGNDPGTTPDQGRPVEFAGNARPPSDRPSGPSKKPPRPPKDAPGTPPDRPPQQVPPPPDHLTDDTKAPPPNNGTVPPSSSTVLVVDSVPAGATITVDGQPKGTAPVTVTVEEGVSVRVGGAFPGWHAQERKIIATGKRSVVLMDLADD